MAGLEVLGQDIKSNKHYKRNLKKNMNKIQEKETVHQKWMSCKKGEDLLKYRERNKECRHPSTLGQGQTGKTKAFKKNGKDTCKRKIGKSSQISMKNVH